MGKNNEWESMFVITTINKAASIRCVLSVGQIKNVAEIILFF